MIDIKVPSIGESITEVTLLKWVKKEGEFVKRDEVIAELESEKASFEVNAEKAGQLHIIIKEGETIRIDSIIAKLDETVSETTSDQSISNPPPTPPIQTTKIEPPSVHTKATPLAQAMIQDSHIASEKISPSGFGGKIVKQDVVEALNQPSQKNIFSTSDISQRVEKREKLSNIRKTISRRLVEAKNTTAMLTTFNEVDMSEIIFIRNTYKDKFKVKHGVGLGFMSFFTKAVATALMEWPTVNSYIDNDELVLHNYADISIAVSTPKGLTVPIIRNVETLSMAAIEKKVAELAIKAKDNKITIEELQGGTFTITNGGVFGSLMSTPIINLPQSAILGMHKIQERPIAIKGKVEIRPMMYVALSYDHRIIDGRESVSFLVRVKELLETPSLLLYPTNPIKALLEL